MYEAWLEFPEGGIDIFWNYTLKFWMHLVGSVFDKQSVLIRLGQLFPDYNTKGLMVKQTSD